MSPTCWTCGVESWDFFCSDVCRELDRKDREEGTSDKVIGLKMMMARVARLDEDGKRRET